jgi:hypothetical protein
MDVKMVKRMIVLGVALDAEGSTWCSLQYRISQAWQHFMARKSQFTDKRIALRKRVDRLRQTVLRTLLHGAGGWHMDTKCMHAIAACEAGMLRIMLCRRPGEGQSQGTSSMPSTRRYATCERHGGCPSGAMRRSG